MNDKRLNVLVIAEAANPEWTSVPLIGWSLARALSRRFSVHLVTQVRNQEAIERQGWVLGREFTVIDNEGIAAPLAKLSRLLRGGGNLAWTIETAAGSLAYPYFEHLVWKRFHNDLIRRRFDIVHRVTPVSPTAPSLLAKRLHKISIPYVVGPLNGGVAWPKEFRNLQRKEKEWLTHLRGFYKLLPGYRSTRRYSSAIIAGSRSTLQQLPQRYRERYFYLPENGVDPDRFSAQKNSQPGRPLKAAFVGRLVPYKGADIAIEAMIELCKKGDLEYDLYGSGPEEQRLGDLINRHQVQDRVRLHGFVSNDVLQSKLVNADLLVFPSIREFGGGVVLEAMALGVVPVVVDYAGPAELVDEDVGYKVPITEAPEMIENLRRLLEEIVASPVALKQKRDRCVRLVAEKYTWDRKAEQIAKIYACVLQDEKKPPLPEVWDEP